MALRSHVKADSLLQEARKHPHHKLTADRKAHDNALTGGAYGELQQVLMMYLYREMSDCFTTTLYSRKVHDRAVSSVAANLGSPSTCEERALIVAPGIYIRTRQHSQVQDAKQRHRRQGCLPAHPRPAVSRQ